MKFDVNFRMQILLILVILEEFLAVSSACLGATLIRSGGLSCYEKQMIVEQQNKLRQSVALGQVRGQPSAANMLQMYWDDELAELAQNLADRCTFQHDSSSFRSLSRFTMGQNLALSWSSPRPNALGPNPDFATQINNWFNEIYKYGYSGYYTFHAGHYSQMVWGDTYLVGCGYSYFLEGSRYTKLYVCNYGPSGNIVGATPYKPGSPSCSLYGTLPSKNYYGLCEVKGYVSNSCYYG